jgi:hypothetical protein
MRKSQRQSCEVLLRMYTKIRFCCDSRIAVTQSYDLGPLNLSCLVPIRPAHIVLYHAVCPFSICPSVYESTCPTSKLN